LNSLESQGLILREADPVDGRRVCISLSKRGRERVEALLPEVFALEQELFAPLSTREKETLITLLAKVHATAVAVSRAAPENRSNGHIALTGGRRGQARSRGSRSG
jgi:DNA-binding PadR family transcriptional regulator